MSVVRDDSGADVGASRLMSVMEAARMLGISRTLAYDLVARQELASVRFGNRLYVLRETVELLVGCCEDEPLIGPVARPTERPARRRTQPAPKPPAAAPSSKVPEPRPQASRRRRPHPEPEAQLTLFEPTEQPTTATPPDPPTRPTHRPSPRPTDPISQADPYRELPPSNKPDALAPGVRRGPVDVAGSLAGSRSGLNGNLNGEAGSPC